MPLEAPVSYLPTLLEFLSHWKLVEAETGGAFHLPEGGLAVGEALYAELEAAQEMVLERVMDQTITRAMAKGERAAVRDSLERFHGVVRAFWADTQWADLLPRLPLPGAALDKYLWPCREGLRIWAALEAEPFPPGAPDPIRIGPEGAMGRAEYAAEVEALRLRGLELEAAEFSLAVARARRNGVMRRVRALLIRYTRVLSARLAEGDALLEARPRLWPLPGHTPDPVRAAAVWLPETGRARLTWAASTDEALDHYQIRGCAGAEYSRDDERVIADISPEVERLLETAELLDRPGAEACYRVYVILKTGNERASNVVAVVRPE
ncbi:MAG: hypothetical protein V4584_09020 [Verrucomicrobiota bacterium]